MRTIGFIFRRRTIDDRHQPVIHTLVHDSLHNHLFDEQAPCNLFVAVGEMRPVMPQFPYSGKTPAAGLAGFRKALFFLLLTHKYP